MYNKNIAFAERIARKFGNEQQHLVAALQIRGGHIVNYGINGMKYRRDYSYFNCSLHAEVDLVRKSGFNLGGDKICVYRFNNSLGFNESKDSKPCPLCVNLLVQAGAGKVYFKENKEIVVSRATDLPAVTCDPIAMTQQYIPKFSTDPTKPLNFIGKVTIKNEVCYG